MGCKVGCRLTFRRNMTFTNARPFDDPLVIAGQGTIGLEIARQHADPIEAVFLPIGGGATEDRYWSESWTNTERVLIQLLDWLRKSRAVSVIEIDEGWAHDRDISVLAGRWAWLDIRALVEEHANGRALMRVNMYLRPTSVGLVSSALFGTVSGSAVANVVVDGAITIPLIPRIARVVRWRWPHAGSAIRSTPSTSTTIAVTMSPGRVPSSRTVVVASSGP